MSQLLANQKTFITFSAKVIKRVVTSMEVLCLIILHLQVPNDQLLNSYYSQLPLLRTPSGP